MAMNEELISIQIEKGIGVGTVLIGKRTDCFYSKNERASRVLRVQDFVYVCVCVCVCVWYRGPNIRKEKMLS